MTILVTKYDGTKQAFSKQKIVKTCIRMGATPEQAREIADQIENKLYPGIPTRRILQMIYNRLKKHKPKMKLQTDLRRSLSLLRSAPDFERYVQLLLKEHGYDVMPNRIIQGRCVTHEVDAIATKNNKTCFVEVKHHFKYHTPTSLDVSRIARAVYEDVTEGYSLDKNNLKIDYAMIVCNTKLSEHAKKYANCRNIQHIAWSTATNQDLQTLIETKKLYPITFLKQVNSKTRDKLTSNGIVMLKQLTEQNPTELKAKTGLSKDRLLSIIDAARTVLS